MNFRDPVTRAGIPALYLTVEDLEGFAAALAERGLPGEDARKSKR